MTGGQAVWSSTASANTLATCPGLATVEAAPAASTPSISYAADFCTVVVRTGAGTALTQISAQGRDAGRSGARAGRRAQGQGFRVPGAGAGFQGADGTAPPGQCDGIGGPAKSSGPSDGEPSVVSS